MFHDSLHVLRDRRCAFILTSRSIARLDDTGISRLGIVDSILPLAPLENDKLREMVITQMNFSRRKFRDSVFPFDDEAIDEIIGKSMGIPRVLNCICRKTLDIASKRGYTSINLDCFGECFLILQNDLSATIPADVKRILYHALKRDGFLVSSKEETLEEVLRLTGASTVYELLPYLDNLVRADYLVRAERGDRIRYTITPGMEKAAAEGEKLVSE
jgi:Holliday junction resolvasome RuvABC ATP-dependent DNA helicase subunit